MNIDTLVEDNSKLIYSVVKMFSNNSNKEDLYQAGVLGVLKAHSNFDNRENVKFSTYAYPYILGEIKKLIREDKQIKVSRDISKFNYKIVEVSNLLSQKLFREPTTKEISDFLNIEEQIVIDSINSRRYIKSIDEKVSNDDKDLLLQEVIPSKKQEIDSLIDLRNELKKLDDIEKDIIVNRYYKDYTQQETADTLGMSQVQVSRKEQKILTKLKNNLR